MPTSTAVRRDFKRFIGDNWPLDFTIATDSGDLTGATILFVLATRAGGTEKFRKSVGSGITLSGDQAQVRVLAADTILLVPARYYYVVRVTIAGAPITTNEGFIYASATAVVTP